MQYEIKGTPFPVAICTLNNGESLITERGSMSWMSDSMEMKTVGGSVGKALGRMFSGESMFQNKYIAHKDGAFIAFASSFPGEIRAIDVRPGNEIIIQKSGFLACEESVELSVHFKKKSWPLGTHYNSFACPSIAILILCGPMPIYFRIAFD